MAIASPREFSQDSCRFLPVYVKTPLFIQPLSASPLGRNCAESHSALRCWRATITFLCKWRIKSGLNWRFLFTDEKLDLLMASFLGATRNAELFKIRLWQFCSTKYWPDINPSFLRLQDLGQYRVKLVGFFQFLCKTTLLYEHLKTMFIFNVSFFTVLFIFPFWVR